MTPLFPRRAPPQPRRRRRWVAAGGGTATPSPLPRKRCCRAKRAPQLREGRRGAEKVQRCRSSVPHVIKPSSANITLKCTTGKRSGFSFPLRAVGTRRPSRLCRFPGGEKGRPPFLPAGPNTSVSPGMVKEGPLCPWGRVPCL